MKHIIISKSTELLRVPVDYMMYVSSDGNYSNIITLDGRSRLVCLQLGQVEDIIAEQLGDNGGNFLRLGRSLIINTNYIYLVDVAKQQLILSDCKGSWHELTASREVLIKLKTYIESLKLTGNE
ncbi:MAG: LytTR family transcriptional regulator DNA-binding domain-containing protein [Bacteroidales bacterium]|nr:LytTR family transcriptional regulator DNA-binding domain-containing protein [Candidatus Cacconaster scatequi]